MTDLTGLTEETSPSSTDIAYNVIDPAVTKLPRKSTWGNILKIYDALTSVFTNKTFDVENATNVLKQTTPAAGEYLRDNGTKFVSSAILAGDLPSSIDATKIGTGGVTSTEFGYIGTLTSDAQTQINGKVDSGGALGTPSSGTLTNCTGLPLAGLAISGKTESLIIPCSDETTVLTTGTSKMTFRMPYAFTLTGIRASLNVAATGGTFTVDVNDSGSTIMTTNKLRFDATEKTTTTYSGTAATLTDTALGDDAEITIDIDDIGTGGVAAGLKVTLIGYQT